MAKVSMLDLTIAQVTEIETAVGRPFTEWDEVAHPADLYARIYAMHQGQDIETLLSRSLRELTELVSLDSDDPDPSLPGGPER